MYRNKHICLTFWSTEVNTEEKSERGECLSNPEFKFEILSEVELKCLFFIPFDAKLKFYYFSERARRLVCDVRASR